MAGHGTFSETNPVWRGISRFTDMLIMGLLFLITSLPVITIGASLCAFYYAAMDSLRKEDGYILKRYFTAFGKNFKKATLLWLILLLAGGIEGAYLYCVNQFAGTTLATLMLVFAVLIGLVWLMIFAFAFPLQARFENTLIGILKNSILLSVGHLPFFFVILATIAVFGFAMVWFWPRSLFFALLFGGALGFVVVHYYETNFKKWGYIAEDDGKIKNDDYEFTVEVDFNELQDHKEAEAASDDMDETEGRKISVQGND